MNRNILNISMSEPIQPEITASYFMRVLELSILSALATARYITLYNHPNAKLDPPRNY